MPASGFRGRVNRRQRQGGHSGPPLQTRDWAPGTTIQRPLVWNAMGGRIGNFFRPP